MPEDKFHKLADDTIHDLLEKLEVMYLDKFFILHWKLC
jgi:frataxin-like iron-binding protein CyaY